METALADGRSGGALGTAVRSVGTRAGGWHGVFGVLFPKADSNIAGLERVLLALCWGCHPVSGCRVTHGAGPLGRASYDHQVQVSEF